MKNILIISFSLIIILIFLSINMMSQDIFQKKDKGNKDIHLENLLQGTTENLSSEQPENIDNDITDFTEDNLQTESASSSTTNFITENILEDKNIEKSNTEADTSNIKTEKNIDSKNYEELKKNLSEKYNNDPNAEVSHEDLIEIFNQILGQ